MDVSVIVPTRNRVQSLARLLPSLDLTEIPEQLRTEVLIVNNDSTDDTDKFLLDQQKTRRPFSLKVLREQRRGKSSAVNCALRACKSMIRTGEKKMSQSSNRL